jgi:hypothetical protein
MSRADKYRKLNELKELIKSMDQRAESNLCFFTHCSNPAIESHTLSKSRVLSDMLNDPDDPNEELYYLDDTIVVDYEAQKLSSFHTAKRKLQTKRIASASTFFGFCDVCDPIIFLNLDQQNYMNNPEVNFLHVLRAHSFKVAMDKKYFELIKEDVIEGKYNPKNSLNTLENIPINLMLEKLSAEYSDDHIISKEDGEGIIEAIKVPSPNLGVYGIDDRGGEYQKVRELSIQKNDFPMSISDLKSKLLSIFGMATEYSDKLKSSDGLTFLEDYTHELFEHKKNTTEELSRCFTDRTFDDFEHLHYSVQGFFPIAGCFTYTSELNEEYSLTFFPEKDSNETHFIFGVWKPTSSQRTYLSQLKIKTDGQFKQFASYVILGQGTNTYFSKAYLETFSETDRVILSKTKSTKIFRSFNLFGDQQKKEQ